MKCLGAKAFTIIELLVIIATLILFVALLVPALARQKERAKRIRCTNNLKNIGLAFKTWGLDRDNYPMNWEAERKGTLEFTTNGEVFRHFQVISNELRTPKVLVCPADTRVPAKDFRSGLSNTNLSYFVGIDAQDAYPQMLLSGDRNLTNGFLPPNRVLEVTTNTPIGWSHEIHYLNGNVLLCDGSVQQLSSSHLQGALQVSGMTNRLAIP